MSDRRIKLAFFVEDMETGERLCEWQQCVMEFKQSELDALKQNVRDKFPESPQDVVDKLVAPLHFGWSREIVNAGFLTVATHVKHLILKHLGYPAAEENAGPESRSMSVADLRAQVATKRAEAERLGRESSDLYRVANELEREADRVALAENAKIPVNRSATVLAGGGPVTEDHRELKDNGQQKGYVVLTEEELAKGFVRPVRVSYVHDGVEICGYDLGPWQGGSDFDYVARVCADPKGHEGEHGQKVFAATQVKLDRLLATGKFGGCGTTTTMSQAIAETYARDPKFYSGTFCVACGKHLPVGEHGEFVWDDGTRVGT